MLPPPVKTSVRFCSPIVCVTEEDSKDASSIEMHDKRPPPDILDSALTQQLDSLALLLMATYRQKSPFRTGMVLPTELLEFTDLGWVLQEAEATHEDTTQSENGKKSLENVYDHRNDRVVIDSPRSALVLLKAGYGTQSLRYSEDEMTESRRTKAIVQLRMQYSTLCEKISQKCVVNHLRDYCLRRLRSPTPLSARMKEEKGVKRGPVRKDLPRILRHREMLLAEWGVRQQALANQSYVRSRQVRAERSPKRATTACGKSSPRNASVSPKPPVVSGAPLSASSLPPAVTSEAVPDASLSPNSTGRRSPHEVRELHEKMAEKRREELEANVARKAQAASEALQRRKEELSVRSKKAKTINKKS